MAWRAVEVPRRPGDHPRLVWLDVTLLDEEEVLRPLPAASFRVWRLYYGRAQPELTF
jgi:hypothetical protein